MENKLMRCVPMKIYHEPDLRLAEYLGRKGLRLACMIDLPRPPENWVHEVNREFFWEPALDDRSRH